MKGIRKSIFIIVAISSFLLVFYSHGGAQAWIQDKASNDELNMMDLLVARPLGIVAAAAGTCVFVVSLPFTLPTRSVGDSFNLFVVEPWKFSFVRDFPDEKTF
jgi:hypothetical protein